MFPSDLNVSESYLSNRPIDGIGWIRAIPTWREKDVRWEGPNAGVYFSSQRLKTMLVTRPPHPDPSSAPSLLLWPLGN